MRKILMLLCLVAVFGAAFAVDVSVKELMENPSKYDGKQVKVTGIVADLNLKTSKAGNKYTTFFLKDGDHKVTVFMQGHLEDVKAKDKVLVVGEFAVEKKVGSSTFKNEIDASPKARGRVEKVKSEPKKSE